MLRPITAIPDRHLTGSIDDNDEELRNRVPARRRSSSVTDIRYEMYTRMLKSLPESYAVREKMVQDGFSETEINDFFGLDVPPLVANSAVGHTTQSNGINIISKN